MRYCSRCVLPDTRPRLPFIGGVCGACLAYEKNRSVNWEKRKREWEKLVLWAKAKNRPFDALLPVSGGKDSFYQVAMALESGLHVLAYTWRPPLRTSLGEENLFALKRLGVHHLELSINPEVEKKLYKYSFEQFGSDACMHAAVYNSTMRMACQMGIPLVIWSENSADVYSGGQWSEQDGGPYLSLRWIFVHGSTQGATKEDWLRAGVSEKDLFFYLPPSESEIAKKRIKAVFLGYYFGWDPYRHFCLAKEKGFRAAPKPLIGFYNYCDLDDPFAAVHHWLKWLKFGFTRAFDNLSLEIRAGRISREGAIRILRDLGPQRPQDSIEQLCEFIGVPVSWFEDVENKWRNLDIWCRKGDRWVIEDFLVKDFPW